MLERAAWRDFIAVTFSVAMLGLGYGSALPLAALALTARGHGPDVVGALAAAVALGGITGTLTTPALTRRFGRAPVILGGLAGAIYTLSLVAGGQCFDGAALVRSAGLISLTWNIASIVGPAATGLAMQRFGGPALVGTLWLLALLFAATAAAASLQRAAPARTRG
jgi:hypothetical protein